MQIEGEGKGSRQSVNVPGVAKHLVGLFVCALGQTTKLALQAIQCVRWAQWKASRTPFQVVMDDPIRACIVVIHWYSDAGWQLARDMCDTIRPSTIRKRAPKTR